jgi:hypothetical protein
MTEGGPSFAGPSWSNWPQQEKFLGATLFSSKSPTNPSVAFSGKEVFIFKEKKPFLFGKFRSIKLFK